MKLWHTSGHAQHYRGVFVSSIACFFYQKRIFLTCFFGKNFFKKTRALKKKVFLFDGHTAGAY
jgi:hypothetical protein